MKKQTIYKLLSDFKKMEKKVVGVLCDDGISKSVESYHQGYLRAIKEAISLVESYIPQEITIDREQVTDRVKECMDKIARLRGYPPYDDFDNISRGDNYFAASIEREYTKEEIQLAEQIIGNRRN